MICWTRPGNLVMPEPFRQFLYDFRPYWIILEHIGPFWTLLDHFRPFWTIWMVLNHFGQFWTWYKGHTINSIIILLLFLFFFFFYFSSFPWSSRWAAIRLKNTTPHCQASPPLDRTSWRACIWWLRQFGKSLASSLGLVQLCLVDALFKHLPAL